MSRSPGRFPRAGRTWSACRRSSTSACGGPGCSYGGPIAGAFNDHLTGHSARSTAHTSPRRSSRTWTSRLPVQPLSTGCGFVTVIDRDVILVRSDLAGASVSYAYGAYCSIPSLDGCNYDFVATTSIAGQVVKIERGFVGIDHHDRWRRLPGRQHAPGSSQAGRVEPVFAHRPVRAGLPAHPDDPTPTPPGRKLIVVGDINSDPRDPLLPVPEELQIGYGLPPVIVPPYTQFAAPVSVGGAGFTDAWTMRPGASTGKGAPLVGFSCCQDRGPRESPFDALRADRH